MPRLTRHRWRLALFTVTGLSGVGCQAPRAFTSFTIWNPFQLKPSFDPETPPLRFGVVSDSKGILNPENWFKRLRGAQANPWDTLSRELAATLKRPVQVESMTPDQIVYHLESGRLHFALVGERSYGKIQENHVACDVIALGEAHRRQGIIVADADSGVRTFADLKGRRFAFGPIGDAVLDVAAKQALQAAGVSTDDLRREVLPVPGVLQYHISSYEVAKEIVYGGTQAGVIDADEYEAYPATGGKWTLTGFIFSQDQFNVLGRTEPVATEALENARVIASPYVENDIRDRVRDFLLEADAQHVAVVQAFDFKRFVLP